MVIFRFLPKETATVDIVKLDSRDPFMFLTFTGFRQVAQVIFDIRGHNLGKRGSYLGVFLEFKFSKTWVLQP